MLSRIGGRTLCASAAVALLSLLASGDAQAQQCRGGMGGSQMQNRGMANPMMAAMRQQQAAALMNNLQQQQYALRTNAFFTSGNAGLTGFPGQQDQAALVALQQQNAQLQAALQQQQQQIAQLTAELKQQRKGKNQVAKAKVRNEVAANP